MPERQQMQETESNYSMSKQAVSKGWTEFFESLQADHQLFALTVVFHPVDLNNSQERWETEYRSGILLKFRKALERNPASQSKAIPFEDFYYFERNESSVHRITGSRKPFHIHALLPFRMEQVRRIWSADENNLQRSLLRDIHSLGTIQSIFMEPIRSGQTLDWVRYMSKFKPI